VFCRIVAGDEPAQVVHATDSIVAFRDINPQAPTHIQIIPKEHVESAAELEERHAGMLVDVLQAAAHLAKAEGIERTGWRLVTNVGRDGGQHVFHLHFHLLGGRPMGWPPG
jgi:histidine triad (HIT) family protein